MRARIPFCAAVVGLVLSGVVAVPADAAGDLVVTTTADSGPGSLRQALADAAATATDDIIVFDPGVTGTILLTSGQLVAQVGGASGNLEIRGPGAEVLTLDGNRQGRVLAVDAPASDPPPSFTLSALTLTHGAAGGGDAIGNQYPEGDNGGGLRATGADVRLASVVVSKNQADYMGGGVHVTGGDLTLDTSQIIGNRADSSASVANAAWSDGYGGGISADDATVIDSTVSDNIANGGGGGGVLARSLTATGSTFYGNTSRGLGGGISVPGTETGLRLVLTSTTIAGNHAEDGGGGVALGYEEAVLTATTIANNVAPVAGGIAAKSVVQLRSSILSGNSGGDLGGPGFAYVRSSLVRDPRGFQTQSSGTSCVACVEDPHLLPIQDNGGPTETILLASDSQVVDRGEAFETTDQRGQARTVGAAADMGAVELTTTERESLPGIGSLQAPSVDGTVRVGERLTTDGGAWDVPGVKLSYQWFFNGRTWGPIAGATSSSYVVRPYDFSPGQYGTQRTRLSVLVTATAPGHQEGSRLSDLSAYPARGKLTIERPALVTGTPRVGEVLRARPGVVSPRPEYVTVAWWVGDTQLPGLYARTLELRPWMRGQRVKVRFTYDPPWGYATLHQRVRTHRVR